MTQIIICNLKIRKLREKMMEDPIYENLDLKYDSEVVKKICDTYLHKNRDKTLIESTIEELIAKGIIR